MTPPRLQHVPQLDGLRALAIGLVLLHHLPVVIGRDLGLLRPFSAAVLIVLILGGYGRLYGAFIGAVVYLALQHFLAQIYPSAWQLGLGLLLVAIALFARNGILGLGATLTQRYAVWRAAS
jgi:ABC-type branched-subunit amino acid transport system permease subunit